MSQARIKFSARLNTIAACLNNACVTDGLPNDQAKNATAALFRNGIAVLQFATIEAFIKERLGEVLKSLTPATVSFSDLSEKLQQAVTISALQGIMFQSKLKPKSSQIAWTLGMLPDVANATANISSLSPYSFGHSSSNLSHELVPSIFGAFGIEGGWTAILEIAKRVGAGGAPDYCQAFKDLADRRHQAAHDVTINIPWNDLTSSIKAMLGIACAFDLLISHSVSMHNKGSIPNKANGLVKHSDLKIRYLSPHPNFPGSFREQTRIPSGMHTVKVHSDLTSAKSSALARHEEHLVILRSDGLPETWSSW